MVATGVAAGVAGAVAAGVAGVAGSVVVGPAGHGRGAGAGTGSSPMQVGAPVRNDSTERIAQQFQQQDTSSGTLLVFNQTI
jgi:hypothetical protein